ncbi:delta-60 repeat domain-containing protein [Amycolatopsis anabasis]|uniref:delta-60 repeat domain-containing protein n=1 Tax=Amycolatopsis anabasis TaxID=1840409 RepID=UPI0015D1C100|nr:delta-60 repeat domain-containing protein [Amycolatopsis anabasis]
MSPLRRRPVALAATVVAASSIFLSLPALPALAQVPLPATMTAGAMPTPQTDGIVWSVAIVGNTVYAGGRFSKARPAGVAPGGAGEVARNNLLAFDLTTGQLLPWAPGISGSGTLTRDPGPFCRKLSESTWTCDSVFRIKASPDGKQIYVVGDFDKVDGQWRSRIARFDAASGALDPAFRPQIAGRVRGLSITDDTVYVGGAFNAVNGTPRTRLAALTLDGSLKPWAPAADGEVYALLAAPQQGRVVIGGGFNTVNGEPRRALMAVDAASGVNVGFEARTPDSHDTVTDIVTDGSGTAYLGSYNYGGTRRFEGRAAIDIATGTAKWWDGCYGDTQAVTVTGGVVYSASHTHDCSAINAAPDDGPIGYYRLVGETAAAVGTATRNVNHVRAGDPIPEMLPWFPNTNGGPDDSVWKNGPWAIDSNSQYVVVGGEFTTVNGKPQQSLTRFAARGVPGAVNNGPQQALLKAPVLTREWGSIGSPVITWNTTWDAQNSDVTYQVFRDGTADPIHTVTQASRPWDTPQLKYVDRQVNAGTYRIKATDADGVTIASPRSSIG